MTRWNTVFINTTNFKALFLDNRYRFSNTVFTNMSVILLMTMLKISILSYFYFWNIIKKWGTGAKNSLNFQFTYEPTTVKVDTSAQFTLSENWVWSGNTCHYVFHNIKLFWSTLAKMLYSSKISGLNDKKFNVL